MFPEIDICCSQLLWWATLTKKMGLKAEITFGLTRDVVQLVRVLVDLSRSQLPQCHFEMIS